MTNTPAMISAAKELLKNPNDQVRIKMCNMLNGSSEAFKSELEALRGDSHEAVKACAKNLLNQLESGAKQ